MEAFILVRYLHFVGIFMVVSTLVAEMILIRETMSHQEIAKLSKIDGIYGLGVILTLGMGFVMWFAVGKPASFYTQN